MSEDPTVISLFDSARRHEKTVRESADRLALLYQAAETGLIWGQNGGVDRLECKTHFSRLGITDPVDFDLLELATQKLGEMAALIDRWLVCARDGKGMQAMVLLIDACRVGRDSERTFEMATQRRWLGPALQDLSQCVEAMRVVEARQREMLLGPAAGHA